MDVKDIMRGIMDKASVCVQTQLVVQMVLVKSLLHNIFMAGMWGCRGPGSPFKNLPV